MKRGCPACFGCRGKGIYCRLLVEIWRIAMRKGIVSETRRELDALFRRNGHEPR